jgi:hypothetical protein
MLTRRTAASELSDSVMMPVRRYHGASLLDGRVPSIWVIRGKGGWSRQAQH